MTVKNTTNTPNLYKEHEENLITSTSTPRLIKAQKFHSKRRFVRTSLIKSNKLRTELLFISALLINQLSGIQQQSIKLRPKLGNVLKTLINWELMEPRNEISHFEHTNY